MKACVLIPSYNEARTIGNIVRELKKRNLDILVIDDGSSDDTAKIAAKNGGIVISHTKNMGKGASIKEGFNFITRSTNYEAVIIMDGDGQHHPEDIEGFLKSAREQDVDLIVGNRMGYTKNMPLARFITNKITSFLISALCKIEIPDTQCGFRLLKRQALEKLRLASSRYDTDSEMLINASRLGFKISSVPIKTIYKDEKSQIHPVKDAVRFIALLIRSCFQKIR